MRSGLLVAFLLLAMPVLGPAVSGADIRMEFTVSDGDSAYYTADLENASLPGRIVIAYGLLNNTLYVAEENVVNVTLYIGGVLESLAEVVADGVSSYLKAFGKLNIVFAGNGTNRYAIVGVPEVFTAYLDSERWAGYTYGSGTVEFELDMSEHDVELVFEPEEETDMLFVFIIALVFIVCVGVAALINQRLR